MISNSYVAVAVCACTILYISASKIGARGPKMARGTLKMARERLVANANGGQFGPRAILFDLNPPPVKRSLERGKTGSFGTSVARQGFLKKNFARGQKYLRSTALEASLRVLWVVKIPRPKC